MRLVKASSSLEIVILDPGLITVLSPVNRRNFLSVFGMLVTGNGRKAGELMVTRAQEQECDNMELFITVRSRLEHWAAKKERGRGKGKECFSSFLFLL